MSGLSDAVARARQVPIERVIEQRGIELKREGRELVGPCPRCGGRDRFAVSPVKGIFNCRGCGSRGDVIALVQLLDGRGFAGAVEALTGDRAPVRIIRASAVVITDDRRQREKAAWLWSQRQPIAGSIAERYVRKRGITGALPPTLGFLPARKADHHPAMIAAFGLVDEPEPGVLGAPSEVRAVHLTLLKPDGSGKADIEKPKIIVGRPLGKPIVLAPPNDLLGIAITEGIEDGLSAHAATGLGVFVAGADIFMPAIADSVPDWIECATIFDHPEPRAQRKTQELAEKLFARGIEVRLFWEALPHGDEDRHQ